VTAEPGFYVMLLNGTCATSDEFAARFHERHRSEAELAFADALHGRQAGRMVPLYGLPPNLGRKDRERYRRGDLMLALRGCADGVAELWLVFLHQRLSVLQDAEKLARAMTIASRGRSAFSVFELKHEHEVLH
jgi:hypothetical protein